MLRLNGYNNRTLHISGVINVVKKPDIGVSKPDIEELKADIEKLFQTKNRKSYPAADDMFPRSSRGH